MKRIFLPTHYCRFAAVALRQPHCVSAYILLSIYSLVAVPVLAKPKLHCDQPKHDFGTVIGQEKITHEFILTNSGDEPVVVSKIKNCCGVESTLVPMVIPPGSNAVCKAVFNTKNRYGPQDKQILLATNLRRNPYFELKLNGTLLRPVDCTPRFVRLGDLLPDSEITQTIVATNLLEQAVTLESVKSMVPGIDAEIVNAGQASSLSPVAGADRQDAYPTLARSWTIKLKSTDVLKPGKVSGRIMLNFSTGAVTVPVMGTVKPMIQVVPERIQLSGKFTKPVERLVMLRSEKPFEITSATLENAEGSAVAEKVAPGQWKIKLSVDSAGMGSDALLRVGTSYKQQPNVVVPLSVSGR
jgi:hypothetical protein